MTLHDLAPGLTTLATYTEAQRRALPARLAGNPVEGPALAGLWARNTLLDGWFYDISAIDPSEARQLEAPPVREGTILTVPPAGQGPIGSHEDAPAFAAHGGPDVHTLCIAGVGSSALGSAALARNVADATGRTAAAVVSGYGTADFLSDALGGWFLFEPVNRLRHQFELLAKLLPKRRGSRRNFELIQSFIEVPFSSDDTVAALALLLHPDLHFNLLVGHSKGNLVLSEALNGLVRPKPARASLAKIQRIVTLSAAIFMPGAFKHGQIIDVMGDWDVLGRLNSSPEVAIDRPIPHAGHHTNTKIFGHLPVRTVLESLMAETSFAAAIAT
jgi:hypothetical protein